MLTKFTSLISFLLLLGLLACEPKGPEALSLGPAGVATPQPDILTIAAPLLNLTDRTVTNVTIDPRPVGDRSGAHISADHRQRRSRQWQ